jgi:uncharacterized protein (TIGR02145 family)
MRNKLTKITLVAAFGLAMALTLSCSGDSSGSGGGTTIKREKISGVSQKGPFIQGKVVITELDANMNETSNTFTGKTDAKGNFEIKIGELASPYVLIKVTGQYVSEVTGDPTAGIVTLKAVADVSNKDIVNINVLTHLESDKVLSLAKSQSFDDAKKAAQAQVLNALGISEAGIINSEDMTLFGATQADAALLAVSVLLQGTRTAAGVDSLLAKLGTEISLYGTLSDPTKAAVANGLAGVSMENVKNNILNLEPAASVTNVGNIYNIVVNIVVNIDPSAVLPGTNTSSSSLLITPSSSSSLPVTPSSSSLIVVSSSSLEGNDIVYDTLLTDNRDGNVYKTVVIGMQTWMAQNLNYFEPWIGETRGNKCYDNDPANCTKYGRLYEWDDAIRVCPDGWHLPSSTEWNALKTAVSNDPGTKLKTSTDWIEGNGTDYYGFGALPGGRLNSERNEPEGKNSSGYWWTATEDNANRSWEVRMDRGNNVGIDWYTGSSKTNQYSIRCIKGYSSSSSINYGEDLIDTRDTNRYKTVKIGTQIWMAQNLNYAGEEGATIGNCYNGVSTNCTKYGRLYSWATAMGIPDEYNRSLYRVPLGFYKGICPDGWHLPTDEEWKDLKSVVTGNGNPGKKLKARSSEWIDAYGTDIYGFRALPGGMVENAFSKLNLAGYWWTTTEDNANRSWEVRMDGGNNVGIDWYTGSSKTNQYSIRCLKDQ